MGFFTFLIYFLISSLILFLISLLIFRFFLKGKCNIIERTAIKSIDDYFKSYDDDFSNILNNTTKNDYSDDFLDNINVIDEDSDHYSSPSGIDLPRF